MELFSAQLNQWFNDLPDLSFGSVDLWYAAKRAEGSDPLEDYIRLTKCFIYSPEKSETDMRISAFTYLTERCTDFSAFAGADTIIIDRVVAKCKVVDAVRAIFDTPQVARLTVKTAYREPLFCKAAAVLPVTRLQEGRLQYKTGGMSFYVDELCDIAYQISNLTAQKNKVVSDLRFNSDTLSDEGFLAKAPLEAIEKRQAQLNECHARLKLLNNKLKMLGETV